VTEISAAEGVRQRNLGRILRLVHLHGPVSRAELTDITSLNRSTIGDLVAELVDARLVEEGAPGPRGRVGRPSPTVSAHPGVVALAVNPEVDALEIAAVGLDRRITVRRRIDRDALLTPGETVELVSDQLRTWREGTLADARVAGIGVAVPGLVRQSDGLVRHAPHLGWTDVALRGPLQDATGLHTIVGNDASLGAHAEHLFGAARGVDDIVYLNGGASGIGGGLVVHGMPVGGAGGYAGEFGQNRPGIAAASDRRAGASGVLEDEVSRARLLSALQLRAADDPTLAATLRQSQAVDVAEEIARQRRILATALANAVNVLNPSVVVLGGFLAMLAEHDADGFTDAVRAQSMPAAAEQLQIRSAALAEDRLLIGAAEAAFAVLLGDPASFAA